MTTTSPASRYRGQSAYLAPGPDGAARAVLPARPLPALPSGTPYLYMVIAGETVEMLAHRFLGSSELWWQIADANPLVFPTDVRPGTILAIPTGRSPGLLERRRAF